MGRFVLPATPQQTPSPVIADGSLLAPVLFDPHFRNPASNNWNIGIQRELPGNNVIDVAYVGSEGHHIFRELDPNSPDPALVQQLLAYCSASNIYGCTPDTVRSSLLYYGGDYGYLPFNAVAHNALFQPYYQTSVGNSNYNSLQVKVTHRLSHGVQLQGAYTWAHALDNSNDPLAPAEGNRGFPRNSRALGEEYGNSDNDVRHIAVINYVWEMPFGKGKGVLNSGFVGKVFEGWQLSGITTVQTGHPFDVFSSTDMERTGLSGRADLVGDPYAPGANTPQNAGGDKIWITNPAAFSGPHRWQRGAALHGTGVFRPQPLLRTWLREFRHGLGEDHENHGTLQCGIAGGMLQHFQSPAFQQPVERDHGLGLRPDFFHGGALGCHDVLPADAGGVEAEFLDAWG